MALNKAKKVVLKALSHGEFDLERSRKLVNLKHINIRKYFHKMIDATIENEGYQVPIRIYVPNKGALEEVTLEQNELPVIIYIHGGGFVNESVDTYNNVCWNLANSTNHMVVSIEYRLAPEHRFPTGLTDCYAVVRAIYQNKTSLRVEPDKITIMGDSAGGNLATVVCQMARDKGEVEIKRQILLYPCTDNDYSLQSKYPSVIEYGTDFLLTRQDMHEYMELYKSKEEDLENPYFSPMKAKDLSNMPKTLLITAQYDPLRDEGEAYAEKLREHGNLVEVHRIPDVFHGYFQLARKHFHVLETLEYINTFIDEVKEYVSV